MVAEAEEPLAVVAELAQGGDRGLAAGEATGPVSFDGSGDQSVEILPGRAPDRWFSWER